MERQDYSFIKKIGELTDDGIIVYDLESKKFIYVNDNFLKIFEIDPTAILNDSKLVMQFILAEDKQYLNSRFEELIATGHVNTTEFRLQFPDKPIKHLVCDVLMLDNGNMITAFVKDISMAKRHEDYLIKYTAQKDTLLDMLTHNLSGPLLLSKEIINFIQKGYSENNMADINKLIAIMQENTQQCIDIVNDFLLEEHMESASTYVKKTRFDVIEKINVTLDKLKVMNKDKKFTLTTSLTNLNITSDAVKFFQIIHNLLSNAIKYTHDGGSININVKEDGPCYIICISDNGIGIPEQIKPLLFNGRVIGKQGTKGEKSSGLGLSMAKKLIDLMDGKIWFESEEGKGTMFCVQLPKE
ncbi:MAG: PAS domain-containing sensor histidine kinase [Bacteroidota bacterium]